VRTNPLLLISALIFSMLLLVYGCSTTAPTTTDITHQPITTANENTEVLRTPIADFNVSTNITAVNEEIQFENRSTGDISSYSWDFGDGSTSIERNASHAYTHSGNFDVSLRVSNEISGDTKTMQIKVLTPIKAAFSVSETKAKSGTTIQFTDNSTGDIETWLWDFGDGSTSSERNPEYAYKIDDLTESFFVTLTVSNALGSDKAASSIQIWAPLLRIKLVMCSNITSEGTIIPNPTATFNKGDQIFVYMEIQGFTQKVVDITKGEWDIRVQLRDFKVYEPDGSLMAHIPILEELYQTTLIEGYLYYAVNMGAANPDDPSGEYKVEVTAVDLNSEKPDAGTVTEYTTFMLR